MQSKIFFLIIYDKNISGHLSLVKNKLQPSKGNL